VETKTATQKQKKFNKYCMEKYIIVSFVIAFVFLLVKLAEIRYLDAPHEKKTMKQIFRDIVFVFVSSFAVEFLYFHFQKQINEFLNIWTDGKSGYVDEMDVPVFTDLAPF
jgi:uncharacterized membrane protein